MIDVRKLREAMTIAFVILGSITAFVLYLVGTIWCFATSHNLLGFGAVFVLFFTLMTLIAYVEL